MSVGAVSIRTYICSIKARRLESLLDVFEIAQDRLLSLSLDGLTVPELLALLERYALLRSRLDALRYELASPFEAPGRG
ncbi:hypothetical protein MSG_03016 [Mycobacterium shigaense]|uniref:Uncharacterized protein n=1 Tax=Mycobacterium shigaense TaxID=722731 RepID=A0A1Z4EJL7_9MYCO|nr:hypothetical protein MSG_03016 [Mycobacterium shigaense]